MKKANSYSQFGEDLEILSLFHNSKGFYVEIGANDGVGGSNTLLLERHGWHGLLVEANPELIPKIKTSRPNSLVLHSAIVSPSETRDTIDFFQVEGDPPHLDGLSTTIYTDTWITKVEGYGGKIRRISVPAITLDSVLDAHNVPNSFEFLSIDVEGGELEVLKGFTIGKFTPRIILVEDNSMGVDTSVRDYLNHYDYVRVHRTGVNDWYVHKKDSVRFSIQRLILSLRLKKWSFQRWMKSSLNV